MSSIGRTQLGKYLIVREVGRGGMAVVYEGFDPVLKRRVAIKVLAPHLTWDQEFVKRFLHEAQTAAQMNHPNIVQIYDIGQEADLYYLVMEYLSGVSLRDLIRERGRMSYTQVVDILHQLASALDYANGQGVVHRDVKPANVMITPEGKAKLTDFGIAKAASQTRLTATGIVLGTPEYMAPEQVAQGEFTSATDRYALAVVAYEMLSGHVPFQADTTVTLFYRIVHEPPPPLRVWLPDLPNEVDNVLARALAKDPKARYPTARAFVAALESALADQEVERQETRTAVLEAPRHSASKPVLPRPARRPLSQWAWTAVGLGLVVLLLLAIALFREVPVTPLPTLLPAPVANRAIAPTSSMLSNTPFGPTSRPATAPHPEALWLGNALVTASSSAPGFQDACGNPTSYEPRQAVDGDITTTWRSAENQVDEQWIRIDLGYTASIERVGITPGYNKVDPCDGTPRCRQNRRLREIALVFSDGTRLAHHFDDNGCDMVYIPVHGITASWLRIEVLSTYAPESVNGRPPRNFVAISEIEIVGYRR